MMLKPFGIIPAMVTPLTTDDAINFLTPRFAFMEV